MSAATGSNPNATTDQFEFFPEPIDETDRVPTAVAATTAVASPPSAATAIGSAMGPPVAVPARGKQPRQPRAPRKAREELTSADISTSRRLEARREYNPLENEHIPLQPEVIVDESRFSFGGQVTTRRYNTLAMHGADDIHFDADDYPATAEYRSRLEREGAIEPYSEFDLAVEPERAARRRLQQPPEAIDAFRNDIANPEFINRMLHQSTVAPQRPPLQVLHERAKAAMTESMVGRATDLMKTRASVGDTFAARPDYNLPAAVREAQERETRTAQEANFRIVLEQLDNELLRAPLGNTQLRRQLEEERASMQRAATGTAAAAAPEAPAAPATPATSATLLTVEEAREFFTVQPLERLPVGMRGNFMSLPEISATWRLLYPFIVQTERHRTHVNAIELVRAMALCGAKYDGCVRLGTRARLGELLDRDFYANELNSSDGRLVGGHEHFDLSGVEQTTTLQVFKFYVVRRNKDNVALLDRAIQEQTRASANKPADTASAANRNARDFMNLNPSGLLDLDLHTRDTESDGTEAQGNQHNIRYLAREFMFCVRVVCIEPPACDYPDDAAAEFYPSDADEPTVNNTNVGFFAESEKADSDDDNNDDVFERTDESTPPADGHFFVHSDDESEVEELVRYKRSTHESAPQPAIKLHKKTAEQCVGKWKADTFLFQINTQALKRLCIRSFLFYSEASSGTSQSAK